MKRGAFGTGGFGSARRRVLLPPVLACCLAGCYDIAIEGEERDAFMPALQLRVEPPLGEIVRWSAVANVASYSARAKAKVSDGSVRTSLTGDLEGVLGDIGGEMRIPKGWGERGYSFGVLFASQTFDCTLDGARHRKACGSVGVWFGIFVRPRIWQDLRVLVEWRWGMEMGTAMGTMVPSYDFKAGVEYSLASGPRPRGPDYVPGRGARLWAGWRSTSVSTDGGDRDDGDATLVEFYVSGPAAGLTVVF